MMKPRIKASVFPQLRADGAVWFGPWIHGLATELIDESGLIWSLSNRMDGTRTWDELITDLAKEYQGSMNADQIREVLDFFVESGWVQDADAAIPDTLSARDLDRYGRSIGYLDSVNMRPHTDGYRLQASLLASRVTVLGVGGVGSAVAANLTGSGVGRLHCVDHDAVELSNLNRQLLYTEADIGQPKADVAVRRLRELNSDITITGESRRLNGPEAVAEAINGSDAFVLCADLPRGSIQDWADQAAHQLGIPWLSAGYSGQEFSLATYIPGRTPCFRCGNFSVAESMERSGYAPAEHEPDYANRVIAAAAQISGHYLAMETINLLAGQPLQTAGGILFRYLLGYDQHRYITFHSRPDCPRRCGG